MKGHYRYSVYSPIDVHTPKYILLELRVFAMLHYLSELNT